MSNFAVSHFSHFCNPIHDHTSSPPKEMQVSILNIMIFSEMTPSDFSVFLYKASKVRIIISMAKKLTTLILIAEKASW